MSDLRRSKDELESKSSSLESRLSGLAGADKKHDLLDMELETAERRISELAAQASQLEERVKQEGWWMRHTDTKIKTFLYILYCINVFFCQNFTVESTERERGLKSNLEAMVRELESTLEREQERAEEFKSRLSESRSSASSLELELSAARGENSALQRRLEESSLEGERVSCQLAEVTGAAASNAASLTKRCESLQRMTSLLEADLERRRGQLAETEGRLRRLEREHEQYKVRAQSVLRRAKEEDDTEAADRAKRQEVAAIERMVQSLHEKIADLK